MRQARQKLVSALSLGVGVVMLAGCGNIAATGTARSTGQAREAAGPTEAPLKQSDDIRACAGVQAVIGHLTSTTARWSPNLNPFDKAVSGQIRLLSVDLHRQAPLAQAKHIQAAVNASARAFAEVSTAMAAKDARGVTRSVETTKVAYRELKKACQLNATSQ